MQTILASNSPIRYDTRCYFNVRSKADISQLRRLMCRTEPATEKWKTEKLKSENGYARVYRQTVRGIRGVSPEEEKEGCGGEDLQKIRPSTLGGSSELR